MSEMTILAEIAQRAAFEPERIAILAHGRTSLKYGDLLQQIRHSSMQLNEFGLGREDRIAIVLPNGPELATVCLSAMAAATAVPFNPDYKQQEFETGFARMHVKALLTLAGGDHPARLAAAALSVPIIDVIVDSEQAAGQYRLAAGNQLRLPPKQAAVAKPGDIAIVLQTSGSTSIPKIVPLTHQNLWSSARHLCQSLHLKPDDRVLHFLPMFHIGGIVDVLAAPLISGGSVICAPSFSAPEFFRDLQQFKPTWSQTVPVMTREILQNLSAFPGIANNQSLRFIRSVSAALPVELMRDFEQAFEIPLIEIFGMTETAGVITSNPIPPSKRKPGSVGLPAGMEVNIVDETGSLLPRNRIGQVVVRGDNLMPGYENATEENARLFTAAGFLTGDLGYIDDEGYLYLSGRVKDMINRGGEKVTPQEIDQVMLSHEAVADAACFAVPHPSLGEDVGALVVLKPGTATTKEALLTFLRERLAFFKIPRMLRFVDKIPRKNGKLQRALLTELYGGDSEAADARPAYEAPQSLLAKLLAGVWEKILKVEQIGLQDDFFQLGGDSLKAASFINELQQKWGDTIYVSSLFDAPTLSGYEKYLRQHYSELVARMVGEYVAPQDIGAKVTAAMIERLRAAISHPAPATKSIAKKNPRAIFVLSPPRSGSTLLRVMLAGHPQLFSPPELYLLSFNTLADRKAWYSGSQRFQLEGNIRALMQLRNRPLEEIQQLVARLEDQQCPIQDYYRMLQEWLGDRILVDKTPAYAIDLETLQRAEAYFENPFYIYLQRHPYGMIRSFEEAKLEQLWYPRLVGNEAGTLEALPYNRKQLAEMIWLILNQNIVKFLQNIPAERQFRLKFEDVVSQPEREMRAFCTQAGLEFAPGMLTPQEERQQRMTDGIHEISRMIGDPKFHQHKKIDPAVADQWKSCYEIDFLADETADLAVLLGYSETVASVRGRKEIEL